MTWLSGIKKRLSTWHRKQHIYSRYGDELCNIGLKKLNQLSDISDYSRRKAAFLNISKNNDFRYLWYTWYLRTHTPDQLEQYWIDMQRLQLLRRA